jgi:hypothetical protein
LTLKIKAALVWVATERNRQHLAKISDDKLLKEMEAANYMCSPGSYWGERPRQRYVIQRELVRLEICKRGTLLDDAFGDTCLRPINPSLR